MNSLFSKYTNLLSTEISPASLGFFRILIGIILFIQTASFIANEFVQKHIFDSTIQFKFYYFQFLEPLSEQGMKMLMFLMLLSTVGIILGRFLKLSLLIFGLSFTYLWLLDKSYFNNHYYFISLLVFLLLFTDANAWGSLKGKGDKKTIPYYQVFILKAQIFIVFFIAGVNKVNYYWLMKFQPMKHILETKAEVNGYSWLNSEFFYAFFSWSGCLFDIAIGFLLWNSKTRKLGLILFLFFNLMNAWLFHDIGEIGYFPFLLLACSVVFLDPNWVKSKFNWLVKEKNIDEVKNRQRLTSIYILLTIYLVVQFLLPFRHFLIEGHPDWTGQAQRFSWRMKIMYKDVDMHFYVKDKASDVKKEVNVGYFLNDKQYTNLMYYPDFIPYVAKYIKAEAKRLGANDPIVVADFNVGFNGEEQRPLVDPELDLSKLSHDPKELSTWVNKY